MIKIGSYHLIKKDWEQFFKLTKSYPYNFIQWIQRNKMNMYPCNVEPYYGFKIAADSYTYVEQYLDDYDDYEYKTLYLRIRNIRDYDHGGVMINDEEEHTWISFWLEIREDEYKFNKFVDFLNTLFN